MTARATAPASPLRSDLSRLALIIAGVIFLACLATMIALLFAGADGPFAATLFDTCRTTLVSTSAAVVALLSVRGLG